MKSFSKFLMSVALLSAFGVATAAFANPVIEEKQQVIVRFERTVALHGALLSGDYLIVHDGALMEQGKPCFFVYTYDKGVRGKLVTTFHCEPVARDKAAAFKITYHGAGFGIATPVVREIQFAGDTEGHRISTKKHHH